MPKNKGPKPAKDRGNGKVPYIEYIPYYDDMVPLPTQLPTNRKNPPPASDGK